MNEPFSPAGLASQVLLNFEATFYLIGQTFADVIGEEKNEETNQEDENLSSQEHIDEDSLMRKIEERRKQSEEQRLFWKMEVKQMNHWINL